MTIDLDAVTLGRSDSRTGALEIRVRKLEKINRVLMNRVEKSMDFGNSAFSLFQTAIVLEGEVKARTEDLESTLSDLSDAYSELQQVSEEAERAKQNLTAAIEAVNEGFALFDKDERLVMCNTPFRTLMPDIGPSLAPGIPFAQVTELFSGSRHIVLRADQTRQDWQNFRLEKFRSPYSSFVQQLENDRWIQVSNKTTESGFTVIFQTDISDLVRHERERRERQLDEQSRTLQAIIDQLPQGICMFSNDLTLNAWNNQFIHLLNLPVRQVRPHVSFQRIWQEVTRNALPGSLAEYRRIADWVHQSARAAFSGAEIQHGDGVALWITCKQMPDGGVVINFADVTAQKRANEILREANDMLEQRVEERTVDLQDANNQLSQEIFERRAIEAKLMCAKEEAEDANRSKTQFLAAASHDLLQPLNAARIFLSLLCDADLNAKQKRYAERSDDAFASVELLLECLMDISRYDSGGVKPEISVFPLGDMLDKLCAEAQPVADIKKIELVKVPTSRLVRSDPQLLRRIVQNFLSNATRYTASGKVLIGVRQRGRNLEIQVLDTGPGIPSEQHEEIFEEFHRLHKDSAQQTGEPRAMGLGLAVVNRIARLLGHKIAVKSKVGLGSCFSVEVPLAAAGDLVPAAPAPVPDVKRSAPFGTSNVILIENDLTILEGMVELLANWGVAVIPTLSLDEALDSLAGIGVPPALVMADYHLDNETGIQAIEGIRAQWGAAIPAVIITADRSDEVQAAARARHIEQMHKPVKLAELQEYFVRIAKRTPEDGA